MKIGPAVSSQQMELDLCSIDFFIFSKIEEAKNNEIENNSKEKQK